MSFILNLIAFFSAVGIFGGMLGAYFQIMDIGYLYAAFAGGNLLSVVFLVLVALITCLGNLSFIRFYLFSTLTLIYSLLVCGLGLHLYREQAKGNPYLNDITTDLKNPPIFQHEYPEVSLPGPLALLDLGFKKSARYDTANADFQKSRYPRIKPQVFELQTEEIYHIAMKVAKKLDWKIIKKSKLHFEAVAESKIFHLPDDVVVEVKQNRDKSNSMRVRSRSRYGIFDFDVNANRISDYSNQVRMHVVEQLKLRNF